MPNTNASFTPYTRSDALKEQLARLELLSSQDYTNANERDLMAFDIQTQSVLGRLYGEGHQYLELYKYATLGEAEALVNLPEAAQELPPTDSAKTRFQQRRQALHAMLTEMETLEAKEASVLTGEDREDPPSL
ncbi:MAG TPA: hypothetical protein PKD12_03775 [Nitrospira sp.]|nr:hypothetical protein [Nitrospira sp.]